MKTVKKEIFEWLANWLMENGSEYHEISHSIYSKDLLFIHIFYMHHVRFTWEELYILLGWNFIKLFSYTTRKRE